MVLKVKGKGTALVEGLADYATAAQDSLGYEK